MPKALCIVGIVVSILVALMFLLDLLLPFLSLPGLAPFGGNNMVLDIVFLLCAAALGYASWSTLREQ